MSRSQRPRKAYKPKPVSIPVTHLRHEFMLVMLSILSAAQLGYFSHYQYEKLAQALNVVWGALLVKPPKDSSVTIVLEGAMRAMNEAGRRGNSTGVWELRQLEQAAISAGIGKVDYALQFMDVMSLYRSMQHLKMVERADSRSAAYQLERMAA